MRTILVILSIILINTSGFCQDTIMPLWPKNKVPNRIASDEKEVHKYEGILRIEKVQEPAIEVYLPTERNANGQAVLIFPGGGYHILAYDWEGTDIAKWLNSKGIAGIVVKYRLPLSESLKDRHNVPLMDAQRAMRMVRSNAKEWHIDGDKVGIMGFSAGGHLASTLGTHYNAEVYTPIDAMDKQSAKPNFMSLIYPVISFKDGLSHKGSQNALLADNNTLEMQDYFSNELQVTPDTPPTFLIHAQDDKSVPVENSLVFYQALIEKGVPTTMHLYPKGGHGFALASGNIALRGWTERMYEWMEGLQLK